MGKKITPNVIPSKNVGKVAGKNGPFLLKTKSEAKRDDATVVKALQTLQVHYK